MKKAKFSAESMKQKRIIAVDDANAAYKRMVAAIASRKREEAKAVTAEKNAHDA